MLAGWFRSRFTLASSATWNRELATLRGRSPLAVTSTARPALTRVCITNEKPADPARPLLIR